MFWVPRHKTLHKHVEIIPKSLFGIRNTKVITGNLNFVMSKPVHVRACMRAGGRADRSQHRARTHARAGTGAGVRAEVRARVLGCFVLVRVLCVCVCVNMSVSVSACVCVCACVFPIAWSGFRILSLISAFMAYVPNVLVLVSCFKRTSSTYSV